MFGGKKWPCSLTISINKQKQDLPSNHDINHLCKIAEPFFALLIPREVYHQGDFPTNMTKNTGQKIEVLQILPAKMGIWQWNTIASALCKTSITTITITLDVTYQEHKAMSRYPKWGQQMFPNYCTLSSVSWFQILGKEDSVQMSPCKDLTKLYFWLEICQISPRKKMGMIGKNRCLWTWWCVQWKRD